MHYWLFITTPENLKVIKKKNVIGIAERFKKMSLRIHQGDKLLIYIKGDLSVTGEYEITSKAYYEKSRIFESPASTQDQTYPVRFGLRNLTPSAKPVAFKPLVAKLSFVKNKQNWGATLQGTPLHIPKADYQTIVSALGG